MASSAPDLAVIRTAIKVLYDAASTQSDRNAADKLLQDFRRSDAGWQLLIQLLDEVLTLSPDKDVTSDTIYRVSFAAIALHDKVRNDFRRLDPSIVPSLIETLLHNIVEYAKAVSTRPLSAKSQSSLTRTLSRICMCYAAAVVQYEKDGAEIISRVGGMFPPVGPDGQVSLHSALPLLDILQALPEETHSRTVHLTEKRQKELAKGFSSFSSHILSLLADLLHAAGTAGQALIIERAFSCFGSWCFFITIPATVVAESPILDYAFNAMTSMPALFEICIDCLRDAVDAYADPREDMPVITKILQGLLLLEPLLDEALQKMETDRVQSLAKLFCGAATNYHRITILEVGDDDFQLAKDYLLRSLVKLTLFEDQETTEVAVQFWYTLCESFAKIQDDRLCDILSSHLKETMEQVVLSCIHQIQFPDDFGRLDQEKQEEFKYQFRYIISDLLSSSGNILGADVVTGLVTTRIAEAVHACTPDGSSGWEACEAALYAFRAAARSVERNDQALNYVFGLLGSLPGHVELRSTCFRIIERFCSFVARSQTLLPPCFDYVVGHGLLSTPTGTDAAVPVPSPVQELAAMAFRSLATCTLPATRDEIIGYASRINIAVLQLANAVRVVEAAACAIALLPAGNHEAALIKLLESSVGSLSLLASDPATACAEAAKDGSLLAACVQKDGTVRKENAESLGVSETDLRAVVQEAISAGGVVNLAGSPLSVISTSSVLARVHLERVAEVLFHCRVGTPRQLALALGMRSDEKWPLPTSHPVYAAVHESERSLTTAITNIVVHLWPILVNLAQTYITAPAVLRKIGRVLNFSMRSAGMEFGRLLQSATEIIVALDTTLGGEPEINYLARMLVTRFRDNPEHRHLVLGMAQSVLNTAFEKVRTSPLPHPGAFNADAFYVESILDLGGVLLTLYTDDVLYSDFAAALTAFCAGALDADFHDEIRKGTMSFLFHLLSLGSELEGRRGVSLEVVRRRRGRVEELLADHIVHVCKSLFRFVMRDWPHSSLSTPDSVSLPEVLQMLLKDYFPPPPQGVSQLANWGLEVFNDPSIPREDVPPAEKERLLLNALSNPTMSLKEFRDRLTAIQDACRGYLGTGPDDTLEDGGEYGYEEAWS